MMKKRHFFSSWWNLFLLLYEIYMPLRIPKHPFHLVTPSPWPLYTSLAILLLAVGLVQYMHNITGSFITLFFGLVYLIGLLTLWWRDVIREATFFSMHTKVVQRGLKLGMVLFIISEIFFFSLLFFGPFFTRVWHQPFKLVLFGHLMVLCHLIH